PQVTNPVGIRYTATGSDEFNDMQMYVFELFDPSLTLRWLISTECGISCSRLERGVCCEPGSATTRAPDRSRGQKSSALPLFLFLISLLDQTAAASRPAQSFPSSVGGGNDVIHGTISDAGSSGRTSVRPMSRLSGNVVRGCRSASPRRALSIMNR